MKDRAVPRPERPTEDVAAYKLLIEYDGGKFQGWQRQGPKQSKEGVRTIAGSLEHSVREAGFRIITLMGAGRTDAGVHALGQVAHLHLDPKRAPRPSELLRAFNDSLPNDIVVRSVTTCPAGFNARRDAIARSYLYQLSRRRSAFGKPFLWWVKRPMDLKKLEQAWTSFEGSHDVSAFADLERGDDPRCHIQRCELLVHGSLVLLRVTATHFLTRQVRRMVGAAVDCATGEADPSRIAQDLARPNETATLGWSERAAPASGLFLEHVRYKHESEIGPLKAIIEVL
jgi:tRNA pseudouridine38-40 synthase